MARLGCVASTVAVCLIALTTGLLGQRGHADGIDSAAFVPFEAAVTVSHPTGGRALGHLHRGSDGSTRVELTPEGHEVVIVRIQNRAERALYNFASEDGWSRHPLVSPSLPQQACRRHPQTVAGFEVCEYLLESGDVVLAAPRLNLFALRRQETAGGVTECSRVMIGDQPRELFVPPPGAQVKVFKEYIAPPPFSY